MSISGHSPSLSLSLTRSVFLSLSLAQNFDVNVIRCPFIFLGISHHKCCVQHRSSAHVAILHVEKYADKIRDRVLFSCFVFRGFPRFSNSIIYPSFILFGSLEFVSHQITWYGQAKVMANVHCLNVCCFDQRLSILLITAITVRTINQPVSQSVSYMYRTDCRIHKQIRLKLIG